MCSKIFENVISPFCATGSEIGIGALNAFGVGDEEGFGAVVADVVGAGVAAVPCMGDAGFATSEPLSQTNFFPDLTHVNFLLAAIEVEPSFGHVAPALGAAAKLCAGLIKLEAMAITANPTIFFMPVSYYRCQE